MRAVVAALMLMLLAGTARADDRVVRAGSTVTIAEPGKPPETLKLDASHFLVSRATMEASNAIAATADKLTVDLLQCQADVAVAAQANQPAPGWYTAVKWAGIGGAVVGSFILGFALGR